MTRTVSKRSNEPGPLESLVAAFARGTRTEIALGGQAPATMVAIWVSRGWAWVDGPAKAPTVRLLRAGLSAISDAVR